MPRWKVRIGFVFRDEHGPVLGAGVDSLVGNLQVACVEAIAIRQAIKFSIEIGLN